MPANPQSVPSDPVGARGGARRERQPGMPWTVKEFADAQRVTPAHIYQLVAEGQIDAVRMGTTVRIPDAVARRLLGLDMQTA